MKIFSGLRSIGVLKGASYFPRFDADVSLNKVGVTSQNQLFPMLIHGRVEAIAGYVPTENYRLIEEGYASVVVKSDYEIPNEVAVYMAVSRKSPLVGRLDEFNAVNKDIIARGLVSAVVNGLLLQEHCG